MYGYNNWFYLNPGSGGLLEIQGCGRLAAQWRRLDVLRRTPCARAGGDLVRIHSEFGNNFPGRVVSVAAVGHGATKPREMVYTYNQPYPRPRFIRASYPHTMQLFRVGYHFLVRLTLFASTRLSRGRRHVDLEIHPVRKKFDSS